MFFIFIFYFLSICWMSQFSSFIHLWMSLEFNAFMFLVFMKNMMSAYSKVDLFLKYFIIQSLNSFLVIFFLVMTENNFFMGIFLLGFLFSKMGLPPFHFWVIDLIKFFSVNQMFFLLVLQKLPLYILFLMFMKIKLFYLILFLVLSFFFTSIILFQESNLKIFILVSSFSHSLLLLMTLKLSLVLFTQYFSLYFLISYFFLFKMTLKNFFLKNFSEPNMWGFLFLSSSIPPSPLFFFKWAIFSKFIFSLEKEFLLFFFFSLLINFFSYFRFLFFFWNKKLILVFSSLMNKSFLFLIFIWFLFI